MGQRSTASAATMAVIFSALMFGALGVCTRYFARECGLSSNEVVFIRLSVSLWG